MMQYQGGGIGSGESAWINARQAFFDLRHTSIRILQKPGGAPQTMEGSAREDITTYLFKEIAKFQSQPLQNSILINSVPKCGTMLLRNILFMFVPVESLFVPFVESGNLSEAIEGDCPKLLTGHVNYCPVVATCFRSHKILMLVRDPYDYVLSQARYIYSDAMFERTSLGRYVRDHRLGLSDVVPLMITGFAFNGNVWPSVKDAFLLNALAWGHRGALVRYEQLSFYAENLDHPDASAYFAGLLGSCGISVPDNWKERVRSGAEPRLSATSSERYTVLGDRRDLTSQEKNIFEIAAPGLRQILGYEGKSALLMPPSAGDR